MRKRDERFKDQGKYKQLPDPLYDKAHPKKAPALPPAGLRLRPEAGHLPLSGRQVALPERGELHPQRAGRHQVPGRAARLRALHTQRDNCLRTPQKTKARQVMLLPRQGDPAGEQQRALMKQAIDSERGRALYGRRFATVEPVFGNLRHNKRLNRFTLRGQKKVDGQWKLYCLVHNIEKLAHHGYAQ
jgi:hypothetical protein